MALPSPFDAVRSVCYPAHGHPVEETAAGALCRLLGLPAPRASTEPGPGLRVGLVGGAWPLGPSPAPAGWPPWMWARVTPEGAGALTA